MPITAQQYERIKAKIAEKGAELSPEVLAAAQTKLDEFDAAFMGKGAQQIQIPEFDPTRIEALKSQLIPDLPLQPQVLATQPATGHPGGDEAAADEWVRGDLSNPAGTVVVYDAPAAIVRQKLMDNPERFRALGYDQPLSPEAVMSIQPGDSIIDDFNNREWRDVADAAVKAGKTPYRYSKAPWLKDGKGEGILETLSAKLKSTDAPGAERARAFLMGVDETGFFGAGTSAREAGLADAPLREAEEKYGKGTAPKATVEGAKVGTLTNTEYVGGIPEGLTGKEENDILREEHPNLHAAGQVLGVAPGLVQGAAALATKGVGKLAGAVSKGAGEAVDATAKGIKGLTHWNPANSLWEWVTDASMAAKGPGLLKGIGGAAAAGGLTQAVSEGNRAGANLAATGDTGTTLGGAVGRSLDAAKTGALWAAPGATLGAVAGKHARWVREGQRYEGLPDRLERLGVEPELGYGFRDPAPIKAARAEARARPEGGVVPIDIFAEQLEKPIAEAAKGASKENKLRIEGRKAEVYRSPEGRQLLPAENLTATLVEKLRERMAPIGRNNPTAVGTPNADNPIRGILNANIGGVSLTPVKGAIPVKVGEAASWLNPVWRRRALRALDTHAPAMRPSQGKAPGPASVAPGPGGAMAHGHGSGPGDIVDPRAVSVDTPHRAPDDLARVGRYRGPKNQLPTPDDALATVPHYQGARRPELEASSNMELAQRAADDLALTPRALARVPRYEPKTKQLPGSHVDWSAPDPRQAAEWERGKAPAPEAPKVTVQHEAAPPRQTATEAEFSANARWKRREPPAATPKGKRRKAHDHKAEAEAAAAGPKIPVDPPTFEEALRAKGVKTVYVVPRRYNAQHHESAIRQLRRKGKDTVNDRDLDDIHNAALRDRDARPWQGVKGGWSAMQQGHSRDIKAAKTTERRVGADKDDGTYKKVIGISKQKPGQSKDLAAMRAMAERGGVADKLGAARTLDPLDKLHRIMAQKRMGERRSPWSPNLWFDEGTMRVAYPATRFIEKGTGLPAGGTGRLDRLGTGNEESEARARKRDEARVPAYEEKSKAVKAEAKGKHEKTRRRGAGEKTRHREE